MSSFWKEVKQTFTNPKQELDETAKAILDIKNKKKSITQASRNEQDAIRGKINDEYRIIGETAYTLFESGDFEIEKIAEMFQTVKGLYQTLDEKRAKMNEIIGRYDEELKILQPAPPAGQAICRTAVTPTYRVKCYFVISVGLNCRRKSRIQIKATPMLYNNQDVPVVIQRWFPALYSVLPVAINFKEAIKCSVTSAETKSMMTQASVIDVVKT